MAVQHKELPIAAVQFHPESILSLEADAGLKLIRNVLDHMCSSAATGGRSD
jgi:anthranilate synthase